MHRSRLLLALAFLAPLALGAQAVDSTRRAEECGSCAEWNAPQKPVRLFGDTYWVGTHGLGAILVTSGAGHVLIDAGLPESAAPIMASIRALGFRVEDVRYVLNSHAHFDHAGGIAAVQRASHAVVAVSPASARELRRGAAEPDDPQFGTALAFPAVANVREIADGDTIRVGALALVAHFTPGHTPGGTTWSWRSCEGATCLDLVYADSQTPISTDGFLYTHNSTYPNALADFARGAAAIERLPCDVLLTPHPSASQLWERLARRDAGDANALRVPGACAAYAATARASVARRVATETGAK